MRKMIKSRIIFLALTLAFWATSASAALVHRVDFSGNGDRIVGGKMVTGASGEGWTSTSPEFEKFGGDESEAQYLEIDPSVIDPNAGAIRFVVQRSDSGEHMDYDAVLALVGPDGSTVGTFSVIWDAAKGRGSALDITLSDNPVRDGLWDRRIYVGEEKSVGEKMEVLLTWGPDRSDNKIYVDGREIKIQYSTTEKSHLPGGNAMTFADYFAGNVSKIFVGVEPVERVKGGIGYWSPLNTSILWEMEFHGPSKVKSVDHNAFTVAGYSGKLVTGNTVTVDLIAEPGGIATFDIGSIKDHSMTEVSPGVYRGTHVVKYAEDAEDAVVVGYFSDRLGIPSEPKTANRAVNIDTKVYMAVKTSNELVPADEDSRAGITVVATNANEKAVKSHPLMLTMSTTDEYTGILGGINFEDAVGGEIEVDWGGVTDSFGEVTAQYVSGFAAKTILVSAKDMMTGDVGVGWIRSYIDGTVDIVVKQPAARALAIQGSMEVSVSRDWLTADGRSRSRITAVVKDSSGNPMQGNNVSFNLLGSNGAIRAIQSRTDSRGRATADYIAGTVIGQVQIEVRDMTSGLVAVVAIELRPDAPAEISLAADPGEVFIGDRKGSAITAKVTDINGNPNTSTDVLFEIMAGEGTVSSPKVATDDRDGKAAVKFLPGNNPGVATVKATVMSREPTAEEISAAEGAIFLYGLDEDPGRLDVLEWLVKPEDEVVEGQDLVVLEDRRGDTYTVKAPHDGTLATFTAEERDRVEYGQTLGYVLPLPE